MSYLQGEVYEYFPTDNLGPGDRSYNHRALIVSNEPFNRGGHVWAVLFTTKKNHMKPWESWVQFEPEEKFGLTEPCVIQGENVVRTPDKYLGNRLGRISDEKMEETVAAIGVVLDASCFRT